MSTLFSQLAGRRIRSVQIAALMGVLLSATILSACGSEAVGAKSTAHRWVVLLCKASDISTVPHTVDYYQAMFTDTKPDTQNARNYFLDQSYGTYDISSTDVMDWNRLHFSTIRPAGPN